MKELFVGLDDLGFDNLDDIISIARIKKSLKHDDTQKSSIDVPEPEECIFDKNITCPLCDYSFKEKTVKASKVRFIRTDLDLMPVHTPIYPFFYNVILCPNCGYAALIENFSKIRDFQCDLIKANITPKFKPKVYQSPFSEKDAVERYKLALLNQIVKKGRASEQGYLCLAISWLYKLLDDKKNRMLFVRTAHASFIEAYEKDSFPFYGMNETSAAYLLGELSYLLGNSDEALRWTAKVLSSRNTTAKIKDMALELKNRIRGDKQNTENEK